MERIINEYKEGYVKEKCSRFNDETQQWDDYYYWRPELNEIQRCFCTVIWYNGLEEILKEMIDLEIPENRYPQYEYYDKYFANEETKDLETYYQTQVLWMMLVKMFGNYGTSPRFGWIEDIKGYKKFLTEIYDDIIIGDDEYFHKMWEEYIEKEGK